LIVFVHAWGLRKSHYRKVSGLCRSELFKTVMMFCKVDVDVFVIVSIASKLTLNFLPKTYKFA
jgi:hypothetical protein